MSVNLQLDRSGLLPAIAQDAETGTVLMLGYVSPNSLHRTLEGGEVWFYSRSRQELWHKGETSGSYLRVKEVVADCDSDTLLLKVDPTGPVCHTGKPTCFFTPLNEFPSFQGTEDDSSILDELFSVIQSRSEKPLAGSYTAGLLAAGIGRVAQKVIEEAGESAIAATEGKREALTSEVADLFYHTLVLLEAAGAKPKDVWQILRDRRER
jgi:phosphoribosyl-ATP pyrophosphohydrolase/phosphoribosyl-AMP cyclohydrolase